MSEMGYPYIQFAVAGMAIGAGLFLVISAAVTTPSNWLILVLLALVNFGAAGINIAGALNL
jgi:hypothetical protein